jgi:hypothetical protein
VTVLADASFLELAVPVVAALGGVTLGAVLPHFFTEHRNAEARYDAAIAAVTRLQSARHGVGLALPADAVKAVNAEEHARIEQELSVEGVRRFLTAAAEARATLAALYPYSPDLREFWDRFEVPDAELDGLVRILSERRRKPTRAHRVRSGSAA